MCRRAACCQLCTFAVCVDTRDGNCGVAFYISAQSAVNYCQGRGFAQHLPHCGNLALYFIPHTVNNRLKRNFHDPCHVVTTEADEEADVEAASIAPDDTARPLNIVLGGQATDCILADGINEFHDPFTKLLLSG